MTKQNNEKKSSASRKLIPAIGMLTVSAMMLSSATYAWFTMNKEVQVTGMQVKAQAEKGLLINEVATATDANWDEEAKSGQADDNYIALRPASTKNLSNWWHANSRKVNDEAGYGSGTVDTANTVKLTGDNYYSNISGLASDDTAATAGSVAARKIFYNDAPGTSGSTYQNGEGYYVQYTYYLKASSTDPLSVSNNGLLVDVTATKENDETAASGASVNLDKSLRVGVEISDGENTYYKIFAPVSGADASYYVTGTAEGANYEEVQPATAETAINTGALTIPCVTDDGITVNVYVWFEGEDSNCKSEYVTAVLDSYQIDIKFTDSDLG